MTRTLKLSLALGVALLCFAPLVATVSAQDSAMTPVEAVTQPVTGGELSAAPAVAAEPEAPGSDFTAIATTVKDTLTAVLIALVTAATGWLSVQLSKWTGGKIKLEDTLRDLHMEDYARRASDKAFAYALKRTGYTWDDLANVQIKSQVLRYATDFLLSQYPEVLKWIDKDNDGVIDFLETLLPSIGRAAGPTPEQTGQVATLFAPPKKRIQVRAKRPPAAPAAPATA